jgi:hypothetical protein
MRILIVLILMCMSGCAFRMKPGINGEDPDIQGVVLAPPVGYVELTTDSSGNQKYEFVNLFDE